MGFKDCIGGGVAAALTLLVGFPALSAPPTKSIPATVFERSPTDAPQKIDAALTALTARERFSGVVLIAKGDKVLFEKAYGLASREYGVANTIDTRFNLASAGKMFTAVTIARLAEAGRISLDDPISKYLDASWISPEQGKVTIAQLLDHTSGFGSYFSPAFMDMSRAKLKTVDDYKPLIAGTKLEFEPGTKWSYSNSGFHLLGAIIEKVTGEPYDVYVGKTLWTPTGMAGTAALDLEAVNHDYAQGYAKDLRAPPPPPSGPPPSRDDFRAMLTAMNAMQDKMEAGGFDIRNNVFEHVVKGGPAGGTVSTAPDMLRFANALADGKLVSPAMVRTMSTPKPNSPTYGYGLQLTDGGYGHTGGFPGISTAVIIYPDGYRLIILSNIDGGSGNATVALIALGEGK
jgi:CubicO group peptidase (beta-lactamase class C family)